MQSPEQWIRVAHILRPQGRKGEVLADLYTESPERFAHRPTVWIAEEGFAEMSGSEISRSSAPQPAELIGHWMPVGRNAGRIVLHFAGVSSIEGAAALAGKEVIIRVSDRLPLEDGAVYVSDLIGASVLDNDVAVGAIRDVLFPATPDGSRKLEEAAPILSVSSAAGDEVLIPFAAAYVVEIDLPGRTVRMSLPAGLVDLNRGPGSKHA